MLLTFQQRMTRLGHQIGILFIWAITLCITATIVALTAKFILWIF